MPRGVLLLQKLWLLRERLRKFPKPPRTGLHNVIIASAAGRSSIMCDSDKAFLFWQGTPTDPKFMDEYIKKVDATLKPYGGEFLVRGKHAESGHV